MSSMDLSAELKELRKQLYTYRYKSLELERQLRTHCHTFHQSISEERLARGRNPNPVFPLNAFQDASPALVGVFTNSLIMEIVANHLPVQDLLKCRLVCKFWAREMAQYLTKRKALVVAYEDCAEAREIVRKKEQGKFVNISTLCILEIPITCQLIQDIIRNFGETLSGLKLDDCNPESIDLFNLLQNISSLEVLSFKQTGVRPRRTRRRRRSNNNNSDDDDSSDEEDNANNQQQNESRLDGLTNFAPSLVLPSVKKLCWEEMKPVQFVERIVSMFPNLEELELLCWSKPDPERMKGLTMDNLKQLTISCDNNFSEQHFLALANLQLKLKRLTLHDIRPGGKRKMRGFKLFLESVAGTLQEMNLNGSGRLMQEMRVNNITGFGPGLPRAMQNSTRVFVRQSTPFPIEFPQLTKLEIDCSLLTDLKTIDYMPKLTKLECKFQDWKGWWHLLNKNGVPEQSHRRLRDLTLGAIDGGCLKKMTPFFSGVTKLDVSEDRVDDVAFRTICQEMRQLSHLRITQSTNENGKRLMMTDVGITGLVREDLEVLRAKLPEKDRDGEKIKEKRKLAYIGNLRHLYSLELAMSRVEMTDLGVLYGIQDLRRISTITLPKCALTDASLVALGEMPSLLVLEMHKNSGVSEEAVQNLKTKKKDLVFNMYSDLTARIFA